MKKELRTSEQLFEDFKKFLEKNKSNFLWLSLFENRVEYIPPVSSGFNKQFMLDLSKTYSFFNKHPHFKCSIKKKYCPVRTSWEVKTGKRRLRSWDCIELIK